jgi:hypothetical protein
VQQLGRIEIIQNALAAGRRQSLEDILVLRASAVVDNDGYGWTWGLAAFLNSHPRYRERFRTMPKFLQAADFTAEFRRLFADDWHELTSDWQAYETSLDYGYDFDRMTIDFRPGQPVGDERKQAKIDVAHGWQSSQLELEAGKTYEIRATGRYQVAREPVVWWSEPGGVTIRYYHGQPLGILLGAIDGAAAPTADSPTADSRATWAKPLVVGLGTTFRPTSSGTLYLRVNEPAGELADDSGTVEVTVRELTEAEAATKK